MVTLSPMLAFAVSDRLVWAIAAVRPTRPTEAPITVEFTAFTVILSLSGRAITISSPLLMVAFTVSDVMLSIWLLSPIRAVTEPA